MPAHVERIEWPAGDSAARVLGASHKRMPVLVRGALKLLSSIYGAGVQLRNTAYDRKLLRAQSAARPTISVGNIVAGGAGKTPFTRWLAGEIMARSKRVAVLHGGYGSDEPALHRQWQSSNFVYEERDRVKAAQAAIRAGADVLLLDDAFQHRRLTRDLDIVLIPAETHSSSLLPAGPLREPEQSLNRADLLVITRKTAPIGEARALSQQLRQRYGKPVAIAAILPDGVRHLAEEKSTETPDVFVVVCAIARPDLLLEQLAPLQMRIARMLAYPDHHEYTRDDVVHIQAAAGELPLLCTEKDAVKLAALIDPARLWVLQQKVAVEEGKDAIFAMLERVL